MSRLNDCIVKFADKVNQPDQEGPLFAAACDIRRQAREIYARREPKRYPAGYVEKLVPQMIEAVLNVYDDRYPSDEEKRAALSDGIGEIAHGYPHWIWDYLHGLMIMSNGHIPREDAALAILSGTLHDIATTFIPRYAESERVLRHADAGAILILEMLNAMDALDPDDRILVSHAVLEHTYYNASFKVSCRDGVERSTEVTFDRMDGERLMLPWLTRWIDRLSLLGPVVVTRFWLTLWNEHDEFVRGKFHTASMENWMVPVLRTDEEIKEGGGNRNLGESIRRFADLHRRDDPFVEYDRWHADYSAQQTYRILKALQSPVPDIRVGRVVACWGNFLKNNCVTSSLGQKVVDDLNERFMGLRPNAKNAFASLFLTTMRQYFQKTMEVRDQLSRSYKNSILPHDWPVIGDPEAFMRARGFWLNEAHAIRHL